MQKIIDFFHQRGEKLQPRGNDPIITNQSDNVYLVAEGVVDLFSIEIEGVSFKSSRKHLFRLTPYRLFFGTTQTTDSLPETIIVVGSREAVVYRLSRRDFENILKDEECSSNAFWLVEEWVKRLLYRTFLPLLPKDYTDISDLENTDLNPGMVLMARHSFFWLRTIEGQLVLYGNDAATSADIALFPVSDVIFVHSKTQCKVNILTSKAIMDEGQFWSALDGCYFIAVSKNKILRNEYIEAETNRIEKRTRLKQTSFKKGIINLIGVLSKKNDDEDADLIISEDDAVLNCCIIIGKWLGVRFNAPQILLEGLHKEEKLSIILNSSRLRFRKVLLKNAWWTCDNGPMLAFHKETGAPIALIPRSATKYTYIDSSDYTKREVSNELVNNLEDFAYFFYRPFPDKKMTWWDLLKFGAFRNVGDLIVVILVGISGVLLGLLNPYLTSKLFNRIIPSASLGELNQIVMILISAAITISVFEFTRSIAMLRFEGRMDRDIQSALWDRLLSLPVPFFRQFTAGDLAMRSLGITNMRQALSGIAVQSILTGIFSVFYLIQLFSFNGKLAFIAILLGLLLLVLSGGLGYFFVRLQMPVSEIDGKISGMVLQFINGISKIRVTGTEDYAFQFWATKFSEKKRAAFKAGLIQNGLRCLNSIFPVVAALIIFSYIIENLTDGSFSIGDFAGYYSGYGQFQNSILQMALYLSASLTIVPFYKRLKPILSEIPEVDQSKSKPKELNGNVSIKGVTFRYDVDSQLILENLSLEINSGEFVALVGESGSGKSTLMRLLLGFEKPQTGAILYDNQDLSDIDVRAVRQQIGVVLQNSQVMQGSIFDNIVGSSNKTVDDAWQAAEMAGMTDDIKEMPMGMHTTLPFGGGTLSGGQRQRLLIARALLKKPRILIFDEATSALDNRTQKIVSDSLERLNATRIVIAHRLSTIKNADTICFLENGKILEKGKYSELMAKNGAFARLAQRQIA